MNVGEVKELLGQGGYKVDHEGRLPNNKGTQLRLTTGQIVNVFDNGTIQVQGKDDKAVRALFEGKTKRSAAPSPKRVFIVYGHDQKARDELEMILRRWGLEPLLLDQLASEGQTIIEKLEKYRGADFAVVLATPDDEGHPAEKPGEKQYRSRQNVVLELGMMLAHLGRPRVAILLKGVGKMERPSDIQGLIYIPFTDTVKETIVQLAKEMNKQGFQLDIQRL